jgi:hypothetical protein
MAEIPITAQAYRNFRNECLLKLASPTFVGSYEEFIDNALRIYGGTIRNEFGYAQFKNDADLTAFLLQWS